MHLFALIIGCTAFLLQVIVSNGQAVRPYMGWSSWSMQATNWPGLGLNWLKQDNVLRQIDVMADKLKDFGYTYINMDSGWNADYNWNAGFDLNGRPMPNRERFPMGIKWLADYAHEKGLKLGLYAPVGLPMGVFGDDQSNKVNFNVAGTTNCTGFDLVYDDWRTTNGWDSSYKIDFDNPCSHAFIDSITHQMAKWGVDFFKLDGVGPGSWKEGPNYDNRPDVAAWRAGFNKTGRKVIFELSWELDIRAIDTWTAHSDGWRINTDVECYCDTLVEWDRSVVQRFTDVVPWIQHAGPGRWNDLDTINVGNGTMDGITPDERQSYMTLWAISCAPLYIGDDLSLLDEYGLTLLTNREVIDINQNGVPARPIRTGVNQQVWWSRSVDDSDSYVVALFNLGGQTATVTASWVDLGFTGDAFVRDIWAGQDLDFYNNGISQTLASHASRLYKVTRQNRK